MPTKRKISIFLALDGQVLCMDSSWKNSRRIFLVFFPELSPLVKLRLFDKQGVEMKLKTFVS